MKTSIDGDPQARDRESGTAPGEVDRAEALAVDVTCTEDALSVTLSDGRTVAVPLAWFPRLLRATPRQRRDWEFIGAGMGIHWETIDEDISVASLLQPGNFMKLSGKLPPLSRVRPRKAKAKARARARA